MYVCMSLCMCVCMVVWYVCMAASHVALIGKYCCSAAVAALRNIHGHAAFAVLPKRAVP